MSFVAEFRRRKMVQIAAVYGVVAWLVIQVATTIEEPLGSRVWAGAYLAIGDQASALERLEAVAAKAARHEPDEGFCNVMNLKLNFSNDPVLRQPEFVEVLDRISGE